MRRSNSASLSLFRGRVQTRQPKITQLYVPVLVDQHIRRLQVAVEHPPPVEVRHPQCDIFDDVEDPLLAQLLVLLVQVVKKASVRQELSHHLVLVVMDAHPHVQHDRRVQQPIDQLHLFNKVTDMPVLQPFFLHVSLSYKNPTFIATSWPSHWPRYTWPKPPWPMGSNSLIWSLGMRKLSLIPCFLR